ncbi:MAG: hypothetical protein HUJ58_01005 [Erysipelotrichaceae bacterium]|nr:hypothetical protein [Erysipelotrichaceae bacterium]
MKTINTSYRQHHKLLQIMLSALLALTMLTGCNSKPSDDVLYADANTLLASGDFAKALTTFKEISDPTYEDTQSYIHYLNGVTAYEAGNYESAMQSFSMVPDFLNSPDYLHYMNGLKLFENDLLKEALVEFSLVKKLYKLPGFFNHSTNSGQSVE